MKHLILLKSVGTFLNKKNKMTYPAMKNNKKVFTSFDKLQNLFEPDLSEDVAVHLEDCTDEWYEALSPYDRKIIDKK